MREKRSRMAGGGMEMGFQSATARIMGFEGGAARGVPNITDTATGGDACR